MFEKENLEELCTLCREKWLDKGETTNLIETQEFEFENDDHFWKVIKNHMDFNEQLSLSGFCLGNVTIDSKMQLVNFKKVIEKAIEQWNEVYKNVNNLVGLTVILTYDKNQFQVIKYYLSKIQIYARSKNFEINVDCLDNRLLMTNV